MEHYAAASGDWLTLTEAAQFASEKLQRKKTEGDILKAGYIAYEGTKYPLNIYAVSRLIGCLQIETYDALKNSLPGKIFPEFSELEKLLGFQPLIPGDVFQISKGSVEKLVLMKKFETGNVNGSAVRRLFSSRLIEKWEHIPSSEGAEEGWTAQFDCSITPNMTIFSYDIRIDRQELQQFLGEILDKESSRNSDIGKPNSNGNLWPWGEHTTMLLDELALAAERFWKNYDPADISTAPTNKSVIEWLTSERKIAKRAAEVMAQILRKDGIRTGPR